MKGFFRLLKNLLKVGAILLPMLVLAVAVNFLRGNNQTSAIITGADIYPPPPNETNIPPPTLQTTPYPAPGELSTDPIPSLQKRFIGPTCLIDYSKTVSLNLPIGWYGDIGTNSINIFNYDPEIIEYEHGKPKNIPANGIKVEIYDLKLGSTQTLEQWVSAEKAQSQGQDSRLLTVSENIPYELGNYSGIAYFLTNPDGWNSIVIALEIDANRGIVINIFPANSQAFPDALALLTSLDASGDFTCSSTSSFLDQTTKIPSILQQIKTEELTTYECPTGVTNPGTEAKRSTIDLQNAFSMGANLDSWGRWSFLWQLPPLQLL